MSLILYDVALEPISASDLERFGYCPLSWWLALRSDVTSEGLQQGKKSHDVFTDDINRIIAGEKESRDWDKLVIIFSLVATILSILGVSLLSWGDVQRLSAILGGLSIIWVMAALFLLLRSTSVKDKMRRERTERIVLGFAIVALVIALNSVSLLNVNPELAFVLELIALVWLIAASLALYGSVVSARRARKLRMKHSIQGNIRYVDSSGSRLLRSERYGLQGRPDLILEQNGEYVPVEVKTGRTPRGPLFSHILQVAAYCLLLEEDGKPVSHGLIHYEEAEHEVEFNQDMRALVLSKLEEMRSLMSSGNVHRNHNRPGKCRTCSRREVCPEALS
ncbi:MAG: CRISPR-associated protein Cas4 [Methanomassiliicoccales archaeon]